MIARPSRPTGHQRLAAATLLLATLVTNALADAFGDPPLCEASAALVAPCPGGGTEACLFVGDNEQDKALFFLPIDGDMVRLLDQRRETLSLTHPTDSAIDEVEDIEAMAPGPNGSLCLFGSHSRNTKCEGQKKRRRFAKITFGPHGATGTVVASKRLSCARLFPGGTADPVIAAACAVIDAREQVADRIEQDLRDGRLSQSQAKAVCDALAPYNAEGAAAVTTGTTTDLWIGLRAPLLDQHPNDPPLRDLAMLLHLTSPSAYQFDRVMLLDLGGRGVRELAVVGEMVYVIAGPAGDRGDCFKLLRFPASALAGNDVIRPQTIGCLPTSSEGLAASGQRLFVTIDGDAGDIRLTGICETPSGFMALSLDTP